MAYYSHSSGLPLNQTRAIASTVRSELDLIATSFATQPPVANLWGGGANFGVDTGVADAYVVSVAPTYVTAYTDGMALFVRVTNANLTTTPTINVNSLGLKTIVRPDNSAVQAGDIASGQVIGLTYNAGTGKFQLMAAFGGPAGPSGLLSGNAVGGINELRGADVASATTPNIWSAALGNTIHITGTATTTGFTAAPQAGAKRTLIANAAWPLTNGANLILPNGVNYTCAAGDRLEVLAESTTQFRVSIWKNDGTPITNNAGMVCLAVQNLSGASQADFAVDGTYDEYEFHGQNVVMSVSTVLAGRVSIDGGGTYVAGTSYSYLNNYQSTGTPAPAGGASGAAPYILLGSTNGSTTASHGGASFVLRLIAPAGTTSFKTVIGQIRSALGAASEEHAVVAGTYLATNAVTNFRILPAGGGTLTGLVKMYGIRKSV